MTEIEDRPVRSDTSLNLDGTQIELEPLEWTANRIHVVDYPRMLPSACVICGAGPNNTQLQPRRMFIDFQFDIEYFGAVYFCSDCFVSAALTLGYHRPSEYNLLIKERDDALTENLRLHSVLHDLRSALTLLGVDTVNIIGSDTDDDSQTIDETESESDQSDNEPRPPDISDDSSIPGNATRPLDI